MGYKMRWKWGVWLWLGLMGSAQATEDVTSQVGEIWGHTKNVFRYSWEELAGNTPSDTPLASDLDVYPRNPPPESFAKVWRELMPRMDQTLSLDENVDSLPDSTWIGRDKGDAQREIDALLDEAIGILGVSEANQFREHIRSLQQLIAAKRKQITEFREARITAPKESTFKTTAEDYEEKIRQIQQEISGHEEEMVKIRDRFAAHLREIGLNLNGEQLEFLLSTVVGDDVVQMGIAFDNVRLMTAQLEQLVEESREEMHSARRYYGMYTVLLRVLDRMYAHLIARIDQDYQPKIDAIIQRAEELATDTRYLLDEHPDRRAILEANLKSQELTLKASRLYRDYLLEQRADVAQASERLNTDIRIANNTYDTVKVSGELIDIVRNSRHLLETLGRMQVPALRGFENLEMKREFQRLTSRLQENEPLE